MAPEILRYEKYDAKADLWSVGAVLFEMSVGRPPFRAQNHVDLLRKIERGEDKIKFPDEKKLDEDSDKVPTKVSPDVKALIRGLLKRNPSERMGFDDFFREASAVVTGGPAAELSSVEDISPRHAANATTGRAHRPPPAIPRSPTSSTAPTSARTDARGDFLVTAATAAYASPPAPNMPPSPRSSTPAAAAAFAATAPTPPPPTPPRIPSYAEAAEPLPFARRPSSGPSSASSGASGLKRPPSATSVPSRRPSGSGEMVQNAEGLHTRRGR